ncbi:MAG: hypothetical protein LBM08_09260 [Dysgonamonadaceae bacterium]|jgi:hypothetical protein|nr:hypothetical protein [Dysgonamonadaceae bacterium]
MKTICSFLMMFALSLVIGQNVWAEAPYGDFSLTASKNPDVNTEHALSPALSPSNAWHIHAATTYRGQPTNASWGSRLFQAVNGGDKFEFWQRQNSSGDLRTLRIGNRRLTPEIVKTTYANEDPSTVFGFDVISTGSAIYCAVTADGVTYARKYTGGDISNNFTKVQASSNYDVTDGKISSTYLPTIITMLDDNPDGKESNLLNFAASTGVIVKKNVPVVGFGLTEGITLTIEGADKELFSVSSPISVQDGVETDVEISFSPIKPGNYTATLKLSSEGAEDKYVPLTGRVPFKLSSSNTSNEHWYFIQFNRRPGQVLKGGLENTQVTQVSQQATEDNDSLKWKITGTLDHYKIVNKATGFELGSDATDRVLVVANGSGNEFSLNPHPNGNTSLHNSTKNNNINDFGGTTAGYYSSSKLNTDDGNRLIFILTDESVININPQQLEFGKFFTGITKTLDLDVSGTFLTSDITCTLSGDDVTDFTISSEQLPSTGGKLQVTFTPIADKTSYSAIITLTNALAETVVVALTGSAADLPFTVSDDTNEYWYYIEFYRQLGNKKAVQYKPAGTNVAQAVLDSLSAEFQWKIVGTFDDYRFVARNGGELYLAENKRYQVKTDGNGDSHKLLYHNAGDYQLYNNTSADDSYKYIDDNSGTALGLYNANTDGNRLKFTFIPPFFTVNSSTLDFGNVNSNSTADSVITIATTNISEEITATLSGNFATAYSFAEGLELATITVPATGGELKVYFKPTTKDVANEASITLTQGALTSTVALIGNSTGGTGIASTVSDEAPVAILYYNLLGVQVDQPASSGIYLVEKIYATGKTQILKVLVTKK